MCMKVSQTGFGVDVSDKRPDDLEKKLLKEVVEDQGCRVLDIGCGAGGASRRLVSAGVVVTGIDQHDFSDAWNGCDESLTFIHGDVRRLQDMLPRQVQFHYCLCNRTIHYLPHNEALLVLQQLKKLVSKKKYISFSGITSDLARDYAHIDRSIETRFCKLSSLNQELFGIAEPIALYSEAEAVSLVEQAGWVVEWVRTSDFGNVKIIAA